MIRANQNCFDKRYKKTMTSLYALFLSALYYVTVHLFVMVICMWDTFHPKAVLSSSSWGTTQNMYNYFTDWNWAWVQI